MRISLIGMAGSGKSYWSRRIETAGFRRFCCDDLISARLARRIGKTDRAPMDVGRWMGFPYEAGYPLRQATYLDLEQKVMETILEDLAGPHAGDDVVVDTTGSLVYLEERLIAGLRELTTMVYLIVPREVRARLLEAYLRDPHPMIWGDLFSELPGERRQESLARCYTDLVNFREERYAAWADVTLDYYQRTAPRFTAADFIKAVSPAGKPGTAQNENP